MFFPSLDKTFSRSVVAPESLEWSNMAKEQLLKQCGRHLDYGNGKGWMDF